MIPFCTHGKVRVFLDEVLHPTFSKPDKGNPLEVYYQVLSWNGSRKISALLPCDRNESYPQHRAKAISMSFQ
jgi:hypothetical protein